MTVVKNSDELLPPPPIEGQEEVKLMQQQIWNPEQKGDWLSGVLTDIREVPLEGRVSLIFDFRDVTTATYTTHAEGTEDEFVVGPDSIAEALSVWGSAMLEHRITRDMVGSKLTIVYDGRGRRDARIYRVFQSS